MKFYASVPGKPGAVPPTLIIEAEAAYDAKAYASRVLGDAGLLVQPTGDDAAPDVAIRWTGSDAGEKPNRRMQVAKRGKKGLGAWTDLKA